MFMKFILMYTYIHLYICTHTYVYVHHTYICVYVNIMSKFIHIYTYTNQYHIQTERMLTCAGLMPVSILAADRAKILEANPDDDDV
jgi:hypothetical protein